MTKEKKNNFYNFSSFNRFGPIRINGSWQEFLTKEDLVQILIENFKEEDGNIDISYLDFKDFEGDIDFCGIKAKGNVFQSYHRNEGNIWQHSHKNKGEIKQDSHENQGGIHQENHRNKGFVAQDSHKNNGDIVEGYHGNEGKIVQGLHKRTYSGLYYLFVLLFYGGLIIFGLVSFLD